MVGSGLMFNPGYSTRRCEVMEEVVHKFIKGKILCGESYWIPHWFKSYHWVKTTCPKCLKYKNKCGTTKLECFKTGPQPAEKK
jgi:hypothetical protein